MAMTQDEFRSAIKRHGYTLAEFAEEVGVCYDTARKWGGDAAVPHWARRILALMDQLGRQTVSGPKPDKSSEKPDESSDTQRGKIGIISVWPESISQPLKANSKSGSTLKKKSLPVSPSPLMDESLHAPISPRSPIESIIGTGTSSA